MDIWSVYNDTLKPLSVFLNHICLAASVLLSWSTKYRKNYPEWYLAPFNLLYMFLYSKKNNSKS